jgi:hypothetical protein
VTAQHPGVAVGGKRDAGTLVESIVSLLPGILALEVEVVIQSVGNFGVLMAYSGWMYDAEME